MIARYTNFHFTLLYLDRTLTYFTCLLLQPCNTLFKCLTVIDVKYEAGIDDSVI